MRIENYLGFPTGLTGSELAGRAILQANKFGAHLSVPTPVSRLAFESAYTIVHLDGNETVTAKCLLIATGADYRRVGMEGSDRFEGTGVYYAATLGNRARCERVRPDRSGSGGFAILDLRAPAVSAGDQPCGRIRGRGRAVRLGQAGRLSRGRRRDGGSVRA